MGKIRVVVGTTALTAATVVAWAGTAQAQTTDYTPTVDVAGADVSRGPSAAVAPAAASASTEGQLPYTGDDSSLPLALVGTGLVAAGGLAVVAVRSRGAV